MAEIPQKLHAYVSLSALAEGVPAEVVLLRGGRERERKLGELGVHVGARVEVVRRADAGPVLVAIGDARVAIGAGMADGVVVCASEAAGKRTEGGKVTGVLLQDLAVGESGRVVGFLKGSSDYRKKLLALGVIPGTPFSVTRVAPLGDPVEITVRGFLLTLRKHETAVLIVERTV